jgi:hypothetical protein
LTNNQETNHKDSPVITAPYETPGTKSLAESVLPLRRAHNTILLENYGVICWCWADSVPHADSCVEAYCRLLIPASRLGKPIRRIPPKKIAELLDNKKRLGLSGARLQHLEHSCATSPSRAKKPKSSFIARARAFKVQRCEPFETLVIHIADVIPFASGKEE